MTRIIVLGCVVVSMIIWGIGTQRWTRSARRIRSLQASAADVPVAMRVPVPWMFVFAYLVGLGLELVAAIRLPSPAAVLVYRLAGYVLVLAGMLAAFSSLWIFRRRQTTTVPFGTPSNLVTFGPYRFSRNPMYVGLTFLYVGIAGTRTDVWPLAILPLLLIYLQRIVIPIEESRLLEIFGSAYEHYRQRVRRWL